jgi:uncharacterized protein YbjT (DUF2867 family)
MPDEKIQKIMVTGASGNLGGAAVHALTAAGFTVRGGCRHPENIPTPPGAEAVRFDYDDAATVEAALEGMEGLLLIAPPLDPNSPARLKPAIDRAQAAGVKHIILNSALGMDYIEEAPLRIIERHLMSSGVNYTILRPNFFMENFSRGFLAAMTAQGAISLSAGDGKVSFISAADVADVAMVAFRDSHYGKEYNLTGPAALDHSEAAKILSGAAGKEIAYHDITEEQMMQGARDNGVPEESVLFMTELFRAVRGGMTGGITDVFSAVTGKAPTTFEEFARRNAGLWK